MKKKSIILSIFTIFLCLTMFASVGAPKKKPILANEMSFAQEVVEYTLEEDNESENTDDSCQNCPTYACITGNSKIKLTPDKATITACIEKFNQDINLSKNENIEILNNIIEKLKNNGIESQNIHFDYFTAHPNYDFSTSQQPIGYISKSSFSFDIDNLSKISSYIDLLTENGITDILNISYSASNIEEEYTNALSQALESAKSKASKLLNCNNLEICRIKEEVCYYPCTLAKEYVQNLSSTLISEIEIEARVCVVFKCA